MTDKARVLVVDDDPGVLRLVTTVLELAGYAVVACASGDDVGRHLLAQRVDVLLTDKDLGRVSGIDLAKAAREKNPDLTVVLMTGAPDLHATTAFRFDGYLVKPFRNNKSIHDAVAAALESRQALRERQGMTRRLNELMAQLSSAKKGP